MVIRNYMVVTPLVTLVATVTCSYGYLKYLYG